MATVYPSQIGDGNFANWERFDMRGAGSVTITDDKPRSGNGSARFETTTAADKASLGDFWDVSSRTLGNVTQLAYDWYRDSSSTAKDDLQLAIKLRFDVDGNVSTRTDQGVLVYERVYNESGPAPEDTWVAADVTNADFWMFYPGQNPVMNTGGGQANYTLAEWAGDDNNAAFDPVTAGTKIVGVQVEAGSGWAGSFLGYADNVKVAFGSDVVSANFEIPGSRFGTERGETINGTDQDDIIYALGGNDTVNAAAGNDVVYGGAGNDTLNAGTGNDIVYGEAGNDRINGDLGNDSLDGDAGNDTISASNGNDVVLGGAGNDSLNGGSGNDTVDGGAGNDTLVGGDGDDRMDGGAGADTYRPEGGDDTIDFYDGDASTIEALFDFDKADDTLLAEVDAGELDYDYFSVVPGKGNTATVNFYQDDGPGPGGGDVLVEVLRLSGGDAQLLGPEDISDGVPV